MRITGIDPGDRGQVVTKALQYIQNLGHSPHDAWLISFMNWIDGMPRPEDKRQVALGHLQFLEENEKKGTYPFSPEYVGPAFHALLGIVDQSGGMPTFGPESKQNEKPSAIRSIVALVIAVALFGLSWLLIYYAFEFARIFRNDDNVIQLFFNAMASIGISSFVGLAGAAKIVKRIHPSFVWWSFVLLVSGVFGVALFNAWTTSTGKVMFGVGMQAVAALVGCAIAKGTMKGD